MELEQYKMQFPTEPWKNLTDPPKPPPLFLSSEKVTQN